MSVLNGSGRVLTCSGVDVTENFVKGARQVLDIAARQNIRTIILKSRSPSCGIREILGVTAALLLQHGYNVEEF